MTPGTKVRTTVAVHDSIVDVPAGVEGVVLAVHPNMRRPVEVLLNNDLIVFYRPGELEAVV